jgi:hypothetical protein
MIGWFMGEIQGNFYFSLLKIRTNRFFPCRLPESDDISPWVRLRWDIKG